VVVVVVGGETDLPLLVWVWVRGIDSGIVVVVVLVQMDM
jgi:hypothetical protein